ncbi:MAG: helix-turn-helix domain-containing protein [Hyphomicrobium sp.]|nr:helix-turn-helix domain-containing protein [Hyphomicrobium sp.]
MRENVCFDVSGADRKRLLAIAADRNTPVKVVWRTKIILATADGLGTMAIMRETGKSKPCVWRWQERFMHEGVDGLLVHGAAGAEATMGDEGQYGLAGKIGAGEELRIGAGSAMPQIGKPRNSVVCRDRSGVGSSGRSASLSRQRVAQATMFS